MEQTNRLVQDALSRLDAEIRSQPAPHQRGSDAGTVVRLIGPGEDASEGPPNRSAPSRDWSHLVEQVRRAAEHVREVEEQAHEQDLRVQELLERVRQDMAAASERVAAAEARARDAQARAETQIRAAEARVQAAEERARVAEEWLSRVHEAITTGFSVERP